MANDRDHTPVEPLVRQGQQDALRYLLRCVRVSREFLPRQDAYLAAMDEIAMTCVAALQRLESGDLMESTSVTAAQPQE